MAHLRGWRVRRDSKSLLCLYDWVTFLLLDVWDFYWDWSYGDYMGKLYLELGGVFEHLPCKILVGERLFSPPLGREDLQSSIVCYSGDSLFCGKSLGHSRLQCLPASLSGRSRRALACSADCG